MLARRALLALSAGLLVALAGCAGIDPETGSDADPGARTQPVQLRVTIPESYLAFTGNTAQEAAKGYADYSGGNITTSVLGDGSLELYVTDHWYGELRTMWEDELDDGLEALHASDDVVSVDVAEDLGRVTVTALPSFADRASGDLLAVIGACGFLQLLDPGSDRLGTWSVELLLVDAETGAEVARGAIPADEISYSRESWDAATNA